MPRAACETGVVPDEAPAPGAAVASDAVPCGSAAFEVEDPLEPEAEFDPAGGGPPTGVLTGAIGSVGTLIEGVVTPTGGVVTCGVVSVALVTDGTVTGTVADGRLTDGTLTDGTLTDGTEIVDRTLPTATAVEAPTPATRAAPATSTSLPAHRLIPAPRTAFHQRRRRHC